MEILENILRELAGFFGIHAWIEMFKSGDYSRLRTLDGTFAAIGPVLPVLLIVELFNGIRLKKVRVTDYRNSMLIYVVNRIIGRFLSIAMVTWCIGIFQPLALINISEKWYWFLYGYVVWELAHWVYHYLGHKVRLFWCLHSTHHAPEAMNLAVSYSHFFLEGPYADFIRTSICMVLGVPPPMLFIIMFIDGTWGGFIHAGENLIRNGRLGFLHHYILTPSHHRVHHARNPLYMDTNFCNLLNVWDRIFKTHQYELDTVPPEYGITRPIKNHAFWDVYFGEFICLFKDIRHAPGIKNKLLYIVMPPGWSHDGKDSTAKTMRKRFLEQQHSKKKMKEAEMA